MTQDGTILLVEPELDNRARYATLLSEAGYDVRLAEDGAISEEASRAGAALVVAHLPDVAEGMRQCRMFRAADATRDTPLLVLTRFDDAYVRELMVRSGATALLMEPPRDWLLLGQVSRILTRFADRLGRASGDRGALRVPSLNR